MREYCGNVIYGIKCMKTKIVQHFGHIIINNINGKTKMVTMWSTATTVTSTSMITRPVLPVNKTGHQ